MNCSNGDDEQRLHLIRMDALDAFIECVERLNNLPPDVRDKVIETICRWYAIRDAKEDGWNRPASKGHEN